MTKSKLSCRQKIYRFFKYNIKNTILYRYCFSAIAHPKKFIFCLKYPFWRSTNVWNGKFLGYRTTWYDDIPTGWQKAFGQQLTNEIVTAFKAHKVPKRKWHKLISWEQIKEKYGGLRLYASTTDYIQSILDKYEVLSYGYCIVCGKPARYMTKGWIEYYCEDCMIAEVNRQLYNGKYLYKDEYRLGGYKEDRLTKEDILQGSELVDDKWIKINYKDKYGIDFEELWGLNEKE